MLMLLNIYVKIFFMSSPKNVLLFSIIGLWYPHKHVLKLAFQCQCTEVKCVQAKPLYQPNKQEKALHAAKIIHPKEASVCCVLWETGRKSCIRDGGGSKVSKQHQLSSLLLDQYVSVHMCVYEIVRLQWAFMCISEVPRAAVNYCVL